MYISSKKLTCASLCHKDLKKYLLMKIRNFCEYSRRQLKYHQHRIKSKISISSKIILNVLKCLIVSLVPLKFLLWQKHHFCLFFWRHLWICYGARCVHFIVPSGRRGSLFFLKTQMYTFSSTFIKKIWNLCLHYVTMPRLLLNWKKHKQDIQLSYSAYNETKHHFKIQFVFDFNECLWEIFSLLNFKNFWSYTWVVAVYLWLSILRHKWPPVTSYPIPMNKKLECKDHQIYITKCWERSVKGKSNLNFIRVIKSSSFD